MVVDMYISFFSCLFVRVPAKPSLTLWCTSFQYILLQLLALRAGQHNNVGGYTIILAGCSLC